MKFLRLKLDKLNIDNMKQLFSKTFGDSEGEKEGVLIGNLVEDFLTQTAKEDLYIFATFDNEHLIASILFSKFSFEKSNKKAFLLSPVAVHTDYQGKGIGQQLINFGHTELKKDLVELVLTYGDINFYSKVGYQVINEDIISAPLKLTYPEGWLAQSFVSKQLEVIVGKTYCVEAINNAIYW